MNFQMPPRPKTIDGEWRKVGFELEFGGVPLDEAARLLHHLFGGEIQRAHHFCYFVRGTKWGDFEISSDSRYLSQRRYEKILDPVGLADPIPAGVEELIDKVTGPLVPFEITFPPLPLPDLAVAEDVRLQLLLHSATGARASLLAAFGFQFNPELPDLKAETILAYLRSFFLLYDWLHDETGVTLARQIAPYIQPFPADYVNLVLNPAYEPNLKGLTTDYMRLNPTRNRPLDLLPLFAHLNLDFVRSHASEADLIKPRPTFHYRLPNSDVDNPDWSLAQDWNNWVAIERLACDPVLIREFSDRYREVHERHLLPRSKWVAHTRMWLDEHP